MADDVLMSNYQCLGCGSIAKIVGDALLNNCSCGANKWHKFSGDFKTIEEGEFFDIQKEVLQDIITRREEYATEKICDYIKNNHHIYTTRDDIKSEIWIYDNGVYKPNGESHIKEIVRKFLEHTYTPQRCNKVTAKIEADTMIELDTFFNTMYLDEICVKNGILNLETRELSEFTPDKIFFNKLPVEYNHNSKCPNINKFFEDILKDKDDKKVLFELTGFCLHKEYFIEKAFMFLGKGRNGKGKTLSLFKTFLGVENTCSVRLSQMDPQSSGLVELHNRLVNLAGDLDNTALKDTGLFKELTGRDSVQVKRKYLRDLIFTNYAKMIFATNELPRVYDLSEGFWSRWVLLEFPYQFLPEKEINEKNEREKKFCKIQDPTILEKLTVPEELSGLLNEALDGLDRLKNNKDFSYTRGTSAIKDFWIRKSDSFTAFCLDKLEDSVDGFISKKELRQEFSKYCKIHRVRGTSDKNMKIVLEDMFGVIESRRNIGTGYDREWCWEGVKFKDGKDVNGFPTTLENTNSYTFEKTHDILAKPKNKTEKTLISPYIQNSNLPIESKKVSFSSYESKDIVLLEQNEEKNAEILESGKSATDNQSKLTPEEIEEAYS